MSTHGVFNVGAATLVLTLGCAGSDLVLPGPDQPGSADPAALMVVSGDGQQAEAGALLDKPLKVQLLDGSSRPVRGAQVQFSFLGDLPGAGLDPESILTDQDGLATAIVRLGEVLGEQIIVAQVATTQLPELRAQFSATAVPPDGKGGGKKGGSGGHQGGGSDGGDD
jgi:hypothetical protein